MKKICLNLAECNGLGDLICATPTIKKLSESYGQNITVVSKMPELFKCNPYVEASYKASSIDWDYFNSNYIMHNSFYNVGKKNERGIEYKHNVMDIRQFHAINLGFMLGHNELECYYRPLTELTIELPENYILIHPVTTWASRTWSLDNWIGLTQKLYEIGYEVISIGKDSSETGFFNVQKPVFDLQIANRLNLMNNTSISDCWHLMQKAKAFVTMDSGLLHLAGTTNVPIIHLGSSLKPEFRIPYKKTGQMGRCNYLDGKLVYQYVRGGCGLECASNMKYALDYWDDINSVPPLIGCLEKKSTYECHPSFEQVYEVLKNII